MINEISISDKRLSPEILPELKTLLKREFDQHLISIVLFGSIVKGNFTGTSDIDMLVVCEAPPRLENER